MPHISLACACGSAAELCRATSIRGGPAADLQVWRGEGVLNVRALRALRPWGGARSVLLDLSGLPRWYQSAVAVKPDLAFVLEQGQASPNLV